MNAIAKTNLHEKYQGGDLITDFRMFCLNECSQACTGCFYNKVDNLVDFKDANKLADELIEQGYDLETCYVLPTDFFDGPTNTKLFKDPEFISLINKFDFFGIATTFDQEDFSDELLRPIKEVAPNVRLDVQVNIVLNRMFDDDYVDRVKKNMAYFCSQYEENTINLAINLGLEMTDKQYNRLEELVGILSQDGLIEINFTFLARPEIPNKMKGKFMRNSLPVLSKLSDAYSLNGEVKYSNITLHTRPGFVFKDKKIYVAPIIPFDEFVFIDKKEYKLKTPDMAGFLEATYNIQQDNIPLWDKCGSCPNLSQCLGKGYFAIAKNFDLPCLLEA